MAMAVAVGPDVMVAAGKAMAAKVAMAGVATVEVMGEERVVA